MARTKQRTRTATPRRSPGRTAATGSGRRFPRRRQTQSSGPAAWIETITSRLPGSTGARGRSSGPTGLVQGLLGRARRRR
jgi:hypothetical protein